jgi:hypothetical protein
MATLADLLTSIFFPPILDLVSTLEAEEVEVIEQEAVSYATQVLNFLKAAAAQAYQKLMMLKMLVQISIVVDLIMACFKGVKGIFCVLKEVTINHVVESFEALGAALMFFFITPFDPTVFCFMWWIVYVILFVIWWFIRGILMAFGMEFIQDTIFCGLRVVDDIDLTDGKLFLTKFSDKVICNCFTLPNMDAVISFKFAKCGEIFPGVSLGDIDNSFGPPAQLNRCYGPCGDTSSNCKYPIPCSPLIGVSSNPTGDSGFIPL